MNGKNRTARKKRLPWMLRIASLALVVAVASTVQGQSRAPQDNVNGRPASAGEVLVKFRQAATVANRQLVGGQVDADQDVEVGGGGVHRLHSRSLNAAALVGFLSAHPAVEYAEPNYLVQSTVVPNDPQLAQLWGLQNPSWAGGDIRAESAWDVSTGSKANVVAVIDTGIDYTHPDLVANIWSAPHRSPSTCGRLSPARPAPTASTRSRTAATRWTTTITARMSPGPSVPSATTASA